MGSAFDNARRKVMTDAMVITEIRKDKFRDAKRVQESALAGC